MTAHPVSSAAAQKGPHSFLWMQIPFAVLAIVGLAGSAAGLVLDSKHLLYSYLTAYSAALMVVLGMLFFGLLHHVTGALWSTIVRRPAEQFLAAMPVFVLLVLPILAAAGQIYSWADPVYVANDPVYPLKASYLNLPFFYARAVLYVAILLALTYLVRSLSLRQDVTGDPRITLRQRFWAGPAMFLYALVVAFIGFDWLMTLDFHWYSTLFGVYVFSQSVLAAFALLGVVCWNLKAGALRDKISADTMHDLGKWTFVWAVFWAYIAFSQWMLIWYANIPESTIWFVHRWQGTWWIISLLLPLGFFVVPFFILLPAQVKKIRFFFTAVTAVILFTHYLGVYWLVMPVLLPEGPDPSKLWMEASTVLLMVGILGFVTVRATARHPLYSVHDPRLAEALELIHGHDHDDDHGHEAAHGASPAAASHA